MKFRFVCVSNNEVWHPIATAPLDGQSVLLYFSLKKKPCMLVGHFVKFRGKDGEWVNRLNDEIYHPTHWTELPKEFPK